MPMINTLRLVTYKNTVTREELEGYANYHGIEQKQALEDLEQRDYVLEYFNGTNWIKVPEIVIDRD